MSTDSLNTEQIRVWTGEFGRQYTDRNTYTLAELDELYRSNYGVTRTEINHRFLEVVPRDALILEVGCNVGNQLLLLQQMGFINLYGIEIQSYAVDRAKRLVAGAQLLRASALALPYPDRSFDLVFTSGVLIHVAPPDLARVLAEIHRCTRRWIWGFEYYAPQMTEVNYRGHTALLWKTDYVRRYREQFPDLELAREERLQYLDNENIDTVFLLQKKRGRA